MRWLMHGTTNHGAQSTDPAKRREPVTYYHRPGPIGDVFRAFPPAAGRRVAVIGLGAGGLAAYAGTGEEWTFYEIDPGHCAGRYGHELLHLLERHARQDASGPG